VIEPVPAGSPPLAVLAQAVLLQGLGEFVVEFEHALVGGGLAVGLVVQDAAGVLGVLQAALDGGC
jgi:hypothetical protein